MPDRKGLVSTLWLTSTLALLAAVLAAPSRTSGSVSVSSRPDCHRRNFGLPTRHSTHLSGEAATDALQDVKAFLSENEEQDRDDALNELRFSFLMPWSFRKVRDRELIPPPSILSLYPLRC
jgi:hypothetical protein